MHSLFTKLKGTCRYITKIQGMRSKWDLNLRKNRSKVYLLVPEKSLTMTHVLVKQFQAADWSTEEAGSEGQSRICVGVFTPTLTEQKSSILREVHDVEMDGLLNQPEHQRSTIGKNLCINYKIN